MKSGEIIKYTAQSRTQNTHLKTHYKAAHLSLLSESPAAQMLKYEKSTLLLTLFNRAYNKYKNTETVCWDCG